MRERSWLFVVAGVCLFSTVGVWIWHQRSVLAVKTDDSKQNLLPTGKRITPLATRGAHLETLNPELPEFPNYLAGQAMSTALDPAGKTLLILTSGFNRIKNDQNKNIEDASNEYVFVYDVSGETPRKKQILKVPNSFAGLAFAPDGERFYVSGGQDDNLHIFVKDVSGWREDGEAVALGHTQGGLGLVRKKDNLASAGVAVTGDGEYAAVANLYNDSLTVVDLRKRAVAFEVELRPGKVDTSKAGVAGGEYPFWVTAKGEDTLYVSSLRDREVIEVSVRAVPKIVRRIAMRGNPNKMVLNRDQSKLFVAADNSDTVTVIDTARGAILEEIPTTAPDWLLRNVKGYTGSAPNSLALSHDEKALYVTNAGSNSVAVIALGMPSKVLGLIPTGWSPNAVSVSSDDKRLYIVDGKTVPGPNPGLKLKNKNTETKPGMGVQLTGKNQYILQLEKADFLTVPVPRSEELEHLTRIVGANNDYAMLANTRDEKMMAALRTRIKHVIYIIKENRTYDQILGDLPRGNGDKALAEFGEKITPNFHRIATEFVDLDNFYNSGEVSGDGWPWSTSGRESDFGVKANAVNYGGRGLQYEFEGTNRDINVGLATLKERKEANPATPDDPDLLPGAVNVAEPDGPAGAGQGKGYIWDAVLRKGLTFREYGAMSDVAADAPREPFPFKAKVKMQRPANPELYKFGDHYYRGFDPGYPDFYREAEWEREFAEFDANGNLPSFELMQLCTDHMGNFKEAISGVNTPERQQADNDYAVARVIERVAKSRYAADTLIFVIEDDSQDGPDHVDAHRSTSYVVGPYVKHGAVVSNYYTTVSMIRTMEDVLGLEHLNLNTATTRPMTDVFDLNQKAWSFEARPSAVLADTKLPLSAEARRIALAAQPVKIAHTAQYWAEKTKGFDFREEDKVDAQAFNRIVWEGLMTGPYPMR